LFVASGHYDEFTRYLVAPGTRPTIRLGDLMPGSAPQTNPDFEQGALNVNLVLRWEYQLGSVLYFVYSRAQSPSVTLASGEVGDLSWQAVRRAPAVDVALIKLSYWWG
jgi:hypothetical protein